MHEEIGSGCRLDDRPCRRCVPRDDDLAPSARLAEDLGRRDHAAIAERHGLAALQHAPLATERDAQPIGDLDVEPSGPLVLDERVADRVTPCSTLNARDLVAVALESRARLEFHRRTG